MERSPNHPPLPTRQSTVGTLTFLLLGPLIWAAHFTALYHVQSTYCSFDFQAEPSATRALTGFMAAATIAALLADLAAIARAQPIRKWLKADWPEPMLSFHSRLMIALAILSTVAVSMTALTFMILDPCPAFR